jgi:hypothetical protein
MKSDKTAGEMEQHILLQAQLYSAERQLAKAIAAGVGGRMLAMCHEERDLAQKALANPTIMEEENRRIAQIVGHVAPEDVQAADGALAISANGRPIYVSGRAYDGERSKWNGT